MISRVPTTYFQTGLMGISGRPQTTALISREDGDDVDDEDEDDMEGEGVAGLIDSDPESWEDVVDLGADEEEEDLVALRYGEYERFELSDEDSRVEDEYEEDGLDECGGEGPPEGGRREEEEEASAVHNEWYLKFLQSLSAENEELLEQDPELQRLFDEEHDHEFVYMVESARREREREGGRSERINHADGPLVDGRGNADQMHGETEEPDGGKEDSQNTEGSSGAIVVPNEELTGLVQEQRKSALRRRRHPERACFLCFFASRGFTRLPLNLHVFSVERIAPPIPDSDCRSSPILWIETLRSQLAQHVQLLVQVWS
mmetsp:Transcript_4259/g.8322  ORF Transcript_4259/g.8322 Transcript_4259/m.8322 type:complete len:317 (+) Transcript_4259:4058-5008(+)